MFEKKFEIKSSSVTEKNENGFVPGIAQARLYITGLGLYEAYINGKKAGDDILAPFCNDYREKIQYQTYDVADCYALVRIIPFPSTACMAGTRADWVTMVHLQCYGTRFAAIAELHIWYEDGREDVIATDETWKYRGSDIEMSDIYDGEVLNRQLWKNTENPWKQAELIEQG